MAGTELLSISGHSLNKHLLSFIKDTQLLKKYGISQGYFIGGPIVSMGFDVDNSENRKRDLQIKRISYFGWPVNTFLIQAVDKGDEI